MATIKVRVNGEIATNLTPEVRLVCQNDKYDVEFEFDESWANSNFKTALFIYNGQLIAIPFDGTICKIPALYETELLHIGVKSNDVVGLHTTTPAKVVYLLSANDLTSNKIPEPSKDVYDEIIALLNKYISGGGGGSSGGGLTEEQVREIVEEETADLQTKTDESLETESKEVVGAINEVKGLAETAKMVLGETEGTAYEGNKGKANADSIAKLQNEMAVVNVALEQSGLVKKYKQPITQEYTERVTADGANVLDGSKAILKKVVGSTVACRNLVDIPFIDGTINNTEIAVNFAQNIFVSVGELATVSSSIWRFQFVFKDDKRLYATDFELESGGKKISATADNPIVKIVYRGNYITAGQYSKIMIAYGDTATEYQPYFTGLKSASFGGIESTNADGTETSTLDFPKTETPLGVTIDFETKKITDYRVEIGADYQSIAYTEATKLFTFGKVNANASFNLKAVSSYYSYDNFGNSGGTGFWITSDGKDLRIRDSRFTSVGELKAWMAENNVTIRYVSSALQSEKDFTEGNEYTAYNGGTEKVLENDGVEFGAENTLTQDYILVTAVE